MRTGVIVFTMLALLGLCSCQAQPEPINYGVDLCYNCKMTLMDEKFGCELITKKGKVYKFDDVICLINYLRTEKTEKKDIDRLIVINYLKKGELLPVEKAFFLTANHIQSPMGSHTAAFATREAALRNNTDRSGEIKTWGDLEKTLH